jgi:hypothetical protein
MNLRRALWRTGSVAADAANGPPQLPVAAPCPLPHLVARGPELVLQRGAIPLCRAQLRAQLGHPALGL